MANVNPPAGGKKNFGNSFEIYNSPYAPAPLIVIPEKSGIQLPLAKRNTSANEIRSVPSVSWWSLDTRLRGYDGMGFSMSAQDELFFQNRNEEKSCPYADPDIRHIEGWKPS